MDVSLFRSHLPLWGALFLLCLWLGSLSGCGDRFNLDTARGRQASIDEANYHLSRGECGLAAAAINPLYASSYVTDEVRIIKASTFACLSGFNVLNLIANLSSATNIFNGLALSLTNSAGDGASGNLYLANDILTRASAAMNASQRSTSVNSYMVLIQLGIIASIERNYGSPTSTGAKGTALSYNPGNLSNLDACALAAALSLLTDSYPLSDLNNQTTSTVVAEANALCVGAGLGSCSNLNRDRTVCDGLNAQSGQAKTVVSAVNASW